jgi:hypothetical protein
LAVEQAVKIRPIKMNPMKVRRILILPPAVGIFPFRNDKECSKSCQAQNGSFRLSDSAYPLLNLPADENSPRIGNYAYSQVRGLALTGFG